MRQGLDQQLPRLPAWISFLGRPVDRHLSPRVVDNRSQWLLSQASLIPVVAQTIKSFRCESVLMLVQPQSSDNESNSLQWLGVNVSHLSTPRAISPRCRSRGETLLGTPAGNNRN